MKRHLISLVFIVGVTCCVEVVLLLLYGNFAPKAEMGWDALADFLGFFFISSIVVLALAIFVSRKISDRNKRIIAGITGTVVLVAAIVLFFRYQKEKAEQSPPSPPAIPTKPAEAAPMSLGSQDESRMPLLLAKLKLDLSRTVYFLSSPEFDAIHVDSLIIDSRGQITSAPAWFFPYIMKPDYQMVVMKGISKTRSHVRVESNKMTGHSTWISRDDIELWDGGEFLLHCHSVHPIRPQDNLLRTKALRHSSPIQLPDQQNYFYQPIEVKDNWIRVKVLDQDFRDTQRSGWFLWIDHGEVAVNYSLFG